MYVLYYRARHPQRHMNLQIGNSVSLSSNGSIIAVGGPIDNTDVGATWIFQYDGLTYQQVGEKLVGGFCIGSLCIPSGIAHQGNREG